MAPTPPKSRFNSHSTAEAVTAGIDLSGKTALVTGCASGIGFETMRVLALRGATVIGAARTLEGARAACANVAGKTHAVGCELADLGSIAACSDAALALAPQLDMLICNAGIMAPPKLTLVRGLELQFATNHIGHYLLVRRLLESVKAAPQGRIVMLSSLAHRFVPKGGIDFEPGLWPIEARQSAHRHGTRPPSSRHASHGQCRPSGLDQHQPHALYPRAQAAFVPLRCDDENRAPGRGYELLCRDGTRACGGQRALFRGLQSTHPLALCPRSPFGRAALGGFRRARRALSLNISRAPHSRDRLPFAGSRCYESDCLIGGVAAE
jgi:NAD(P)-dependent dehydrogenase (short-subunit alcohol dehydrogenase family)